MKIKRQRKLSCETFKNPSSGNHFFNKLKIVQLKTLDTRYIQITLLKLVTKKMEGEK